MENIIMITPQESQSLNLADLLADDSNDVLSDYLRISVSNDGNGAKVTVSTTDEQPTVYSATFYGSTATDLSGILSEIIDINHDSVV